MHGKVATKRKYLLGFDHDLVCSIKLLIKQESCESMKTRKSRSRAGVTGGGCHRPKKIGSESEKNFKQSARKVMYHRKMQKRSNCISSLILNYSIMEEL